MKEVTLQVIEVLMEKVIGANMWVFFSAMLTRDFPPYLLLVKFLSEVTLELPRTFRLQDFAFFPSQLHFTPAFKQRHPISIYCAQTRIPPSS